MGRIGETIKVIPANDGELYMISGGRRYWIARFNGRVEIEENRHRLFDRVKENGTRFWRIDNIEPSNRGITACKVGD